MIHHPRFKSEVLRGSHGVRSILAIIQFLKSILGSLNFPLRCRRSCTQAPVKRSSAVIIDISPFAWSPGPGLCLAGLSFK